MDNPKDQEPEVIIKPIITTDHIFSKIQSAIQQVQILKK